jgi:hypothetical protein
VAVGCSFDTKGPSGVPDRPDAAPIAVLAQSVTVRLAALIDRAGPTVLKLSSPDGTTLGVMSRPGVAEAADDGTGETIGSQADFRPAFPIEFSDDAESDPETMPPGSILCSDGVNFCEFFANPGSIAGPTSFENAFAGESALGAWRLCLGDAVLDGLRTQLVRFEIEISTDEGGVLEASSGDVNLTVADDGYNGNLDSMACATATVTP